MRTETLFCSELDPKHVAWLQSHNWHRVSAQEVFLKWKTNEWTTTKKPRPNLPLIWCERKSSLTTGGLSGWNTKTVRYPIMFKLAVHQGSWFGTDDTASVGYYIRRSIYKEETGIMWDGNTWFFKSEGIHCLQKFHCQKQVLLKQNCMTLPVRSFSHLAHPSSQHPLFHHFLPSWNFTHLYRTISNSQVVSFICLKFHERNVFLCFGRLMVSLSALVS